MSFAHNTIQLGRSEGTRGDVAFDADGLLRPVNETRRRKLTQQPSHRLAMAILERAAMDLLGYCRATRGVERKLFLDARRWISTRSRESYFCFDSICDLADIDARRLRRRLLSLAEAIDRDGPRAYAEGAGVDLVAAAHGVTLGSGQRCDRT